MDEYEENEWRKLPVVIKAKRMREHFVTQTMEGELAGKPGDWLITGVRGEQYPCDDGVFRQTYESATVTISSDGWSLKRLAWAYGCAKKDTQEESRLQAALLRRIGKHAEHEGEIDMILSVQDLEHAAHELETANVKGEFPAFSRVAQYLTALALSKNERKRGVREHLERQSDLPEGWARLDTGVAGADWSARDENETYGETEITIGPGQTWVWQRYDDEENQVVLNSTVLPALIRAAGLDDEDGDETPEAAERRRWMASLDVRDSNGRVLSSYLRVAFVFGAEYEATYKERRKVTVDHGDSE